jgi:hypothetical protein
LFSQKKETKEKATPLPLVSFGLSAASGRLRNSRFQHSNKSSPLSICWLKPKARHRGFKVKTRYAQNDKLEVPCKPISMRL